MFLQKSLRAQILALLGGSLALILITALACMPMIVIAIAIAKGQETLDVGTIGALFLLAGLPILVYHLFRWLALAALVFIPFLND